MQRRAPGDDRFDMRALGQHFGRELPHARESGIVQPQPAVAREHRDRFGQIVERLALHADQRVEAALQIEPLGDVVEQIGHAAFGIGRRDDAQCSPVRQVPEEFARFERAIGFVKLVFPLPEILLLRQFAGGAQPVEQRGIARALIQETGIEVPERTISGVVECQRVVGAENRDAGRELIERAAMRVHHAGKFGAHALDFGGVDRDAGAAAPRRHFQHVENAPGAGRDRGDAGRERLARRIACGRIHRARRGRAIPARGRSRRLDSWLRPL